MMIEKLKLFLKDDNYLNDFIDLSYEAWRKSKEIKQSSKVKDIDADKDLEVVNYWIILPNHKMLISLLLLRMGKCLLDITS